MVGNGFDEPRTGESPGYLGTQQDVILPRVGAFIVDYIISIVVAIAFAVLAVGSTQSRGLAFFAIVIGFFGYYVLLEGAFGQTLGKKFFGVIVVSTDGSSITFTQAAVRNVLRIIDGILNYAVGLVVMLLNDDRQRVGDIAANTVVVRAK